MKVECLALNGVHLAPPLSFSLEPRNRNMKNKSKKIAGGEYPSGTEASNSK